MRQSKSIIPPEPAQEPQTIFPELMQRLAPEPLSFKKHAPDMVRIRKFDGEVRRTGRERRYRKSGADAELFWPQGLKNGVQGIAAFQVAANDSEGNHPTTSLPHQQQRVALRRCKKH